MIDLINKKLGLIRLNPLRIQEFAIIMVMVVSFMRCEPEKAVTQRVQSMNMGFAIPSVTSSTAIAGDSQLKEFRADNRIRNPGHEKVNIVQTSMPGISIYSLSKD